MGLPPLPRPPEDRGKPLGDVVYLNTEGPLRVSAVNATSITVTAGGKRTFECAVNNALAKCGAWRLGHSSGRRALLRVVPPYREIVVWPRAKR